jgi:hypothetical protein
MRDERAVGIGHRGGRLVIAIEAIMLFQNGRVVGGKLRDRCAIEGLNSFGYAASPSFAA